MLEMELRARDLERASRSDPSILDRNELLWLMQDDVWSVRMHVCRMLARVQWPTEDYPVVRDFALRQAEDENAFVRAWALDALASFACRDEALQPRVLYMLETALSTDKPAVRVRAREGLRRLGTATLLRASFLDEVIDSRSNLGG